MAKYKKLRIGAEFIKQIVYRLKAAIILFAFIAWGASVSAPAQTAKLPSAEGIVGDYQKAAGGKKRLTAIKSAVYDWKITRRAANLPNDAEKARTSLQSPTFFRFDLIGDGSAATATNGNTVWRRDAAGKLQTLTDAESKAYRLQAILAATRLADLKKQRIAARFAGTQITGGETVNVVEFAARNGASVRYFFSRKTGLPIKIENSALRYSACFSDYRIENGILEPHRVTEPCSEPDKNPDYSIFELQKVSYNSSFNAAIFDPPPTLENFDLAALVEELRKNEIALQERVSEYSFVQTETERVYDGKGAVKKEIRKTFEVFPTRDGKRVLKLTSENGVPLAGGKLIREEQRVVKELERSEAEYARKQEKSGAGQKAEPERRGNVNPSEGGLERQAILTILRVSEVYSPRFESFRDREAIVFNFRPRPGYKPSGFFDAVFSKLAGTVWIDAAEKQIVRAETRIVENVKLGGGLLATFRKDSAIVFERARFGEVWLPKSFQANASAKFLLVGGFDALSEIEYGEYNRYTTEVKDYKLNETGKP